jgi:hypothetical protein
LSPRAVPKTSPTIVDFGVIEGGIRERETERVSRSIAFGCLVLETIFGIPRSEVEEHIVDGGGDRGIDIFYIDHDSCRINIGSCKSVLSFKNSKRIFLATKLTR